jgi:hypothetical protein
MVYNTRDYWVFGFRPSSNILKNKIFQKLDLFPSLGKRMGGGGTYSVGSRD